MGEKRDTATPVLSYANTFTSVHHGDDAVAAVVPVSSRTMIEALVFALTMG